MDIKYQNLADHLQAQLAPIYLICGDEPLIVEESCDLVIAQARARGFTERSVHHAEGNFVWDSLSQDAASMSLFAEKKILDVRVATKKFDRQAYEFLRGWRGSGEHSGGGSHPAAAYRPLR